MNAGSITTYFWRWPTLQFPIWTFAVLLLAPAQTTAQANAASNLGQLHVRNYSRKTYGGGTQNWDISQDSSGRLYFANNDGLLTYDGTYWELYPLPKRTVVRSVWAAPDGRIFIGGQGELGYFQADQKGQLSYHSLCALIPEQYGNFEDVWDIVPFGDKVYFRTNKLLFCLFNDSMEALVSNQPLQYLGKANNQLFLQKGDGSLSQFRESDFVPLVSPFEKEKMLITAILPWKADTLLFCTLKNGIYASSRDQVFPWKSTYDASFKTSRIYTACTLGEGHLAIGTTLSGLFILDSLRRIEHHLFKENGLQNNTVLTLSADHQGNLWSGLDNGISWIHIQSAFSRISPNGALEGTGYTAIAFENRLYFGTNTGLYCIPRQSYYPPTMKTEFAKVANGDGQVWGLNQIGGHLLAGLHEGAYEVKGYNANPVASLQGVWKFIELTPELALAGHYNGLALFKKSAGTWKFDGQLEGLEESCRIITKDDEGRIWMSHPYRGVYQLLVNAEEKKVSYFFYDESKGLPSKQNNYVFSLAGKAFVATEKGVYRYQESVDKFLPDPHFHELLGSETWVKYLNQDDNGNIWYSTESETGILMVDDLALDKKVKRMPIPELTNRLVGGFEFMLPLDKHNIFIATEEGFLLFNPSRYHQSPPPGLNFHSVRLQQNDSLLYGGWQSPEAEITTLSARHNALVFTWSANDFADGNYMDYAFHLEGLEDGWSDWAGATSTVFNNLPPGEYTFQVKARNKHHIESPVASWSFEILAPWYASTWAYTIYSLLVIGGLVYLLYTQQRKFEKEKAQLESTHQKREAQHLERAQQSEAVIETLRNEKLQAEISHKNKELATTTMHLVQKSELMNNLRKTLQKISSKKELDHHARTEIDRLVRIIDRDANLDEEWNRFSRNFDEVHSDFLQRIREKQPQLSPNDYKLCAYLRMNLSTKEIASLLNLSVRGVEASRYRLRKRLGLPTGENLIDFLLEI